MVEVMGVMEWAYLHGVPLMALKLDYKAAFKRVRVREEDTWLLCYKVGEQCL